MGRGSVTVIRGGDRTAFRSAEAIDGVPTPS
jgi:hypothetical protein